MSFELRVEFSGLCIYVRHDDGEHMGILMPDCRKRTANPLHDDGTEGVFHVGYVRFDLANLVAGLPPGDRWDGPQYEVIHRFDRQVLHFDIPDADDPMGLSLPIPDFSEFAPSLELLPDLFTAEPPKVLLMRTILQGGKVSAFPEGKDWRFSNALKPDADEEYSGQFASFATWKRQVDADGLTLRITEFDGSDAVEIPLKPGPDGIIRLKVANLCSDNPIEWQDFKLRLVVDDDVDFKWLYRLLRPTQDTIKDLLRGKDLPVPELSGGPQPAGSEDCIGGTVQASFPVK